MCLFRPTVWVHRVQNITPALLAQHDVHALILDIDNTLTVHNDPNIAPEVRSWLQQMQQAGVELIILSNNRPERVAPFAGALGLRFIANGKKPLGSGFARCLAQLQAQKKQVAIVGDQLFTDMLGGNLFGCRTVLVDLIEPETALFFRIKRALERWLMCNWKRGGDAA